MVHKWAYAVLAIVLDFAALCPANAQPGFLSASAADDSVRRANSLVRQAGNKGVLLTVNRQGRTFFTAIESK